MSSKKLSQQQLRQMMKERQQKRQTETSDESVAKLAPKKIESPLARYEANGRLSCIVCNEYLSSDNLWSLHITSKTHKNKIEEIKRKKLSQTKTNDVKTNVKVIQEVKQPMKRKLETNDNTISQKIAKSSVDIKEEIKTNDSMEIDVKSEPNSLQNNVSNESRLPNDFFDNSKQSIEDNKVSEVNETDEQMETNSLPKGFFDDPVMDAKARKVVYKNPIDEQWEEFQKVIAEENNVSENIIEEEVEELLNERNIDEIEEQIANWIKVNEMQKRAEILHNHIINTNVKPEDSDSDVDEQDLNAFSNWRSRTALNSK